jgi:4'-phosphopantetheinyl transferase
VQDRVLGAPAPDELYVWSLRFADAAAIGDRLERSLDDEERERARRFATEELRRRWAIGRGALRQILAGHLDTGPRDVPIVSLPCTVCGGPHGKPALSPPAAGLHFNVSHTTDLLLVVVAQDREVGIDVEPLGRARTVAAIAPSWLAEGEEQAVGSLPIEEREGALLRLWTFKEAYLKAVGVGLNGDLRAVSVELDGTLQAAPAEPDPERWWLAPVDAEDGTVVAVAAGRENVGVSLQVTVRPFRQAWSR